MQVEGQGDTAGSGYIAKAPVEKRLRSSSSCNITDKKGSFQTHMPSTLDTVK